jgi:hypothetical protein
MSIGTQYTWNNIHARGVLIGVTKILNETCVINYVDNNGLSKQQIVPFFYSATGDERFLQDHFDFWDICGEQKIDGNFDVIPRGMISLAPPQINTGNMTNRFVRGTYQKIEDNYWVKKSAYINPIPLDYTLNIQIQTDLYEDLFKIQQSLIEKFYKTQVFSILYKGFRVPCQIGFPEDFGIEKTFEFTYNESNKNKMSFSLAVESYLPVIDPKTEFSTNSTLEESINNISVKTEKDEQFSFKFLNLINGQIIYSGTQYRIEWTTQGYIPLVNLLYSTNLLEWTYIERGINNTGIYDWNVPFFSDGGQIEEDPINVFVISDTGKGGKMRALISENGELEQLIYIKRGWGYNITDQIIVEPKEEGEWTRPNLMACLNSTNGLDHANIITRGSGLPPSKIQTIYLKIESLNGTVSHIANWVPTFNGEIDPNIEIEDGIIFNLEPKFDQNLLLEWGIGDNEKITGYGLQENTFIKNIILDENKLVINKLNTVETKSLFSLKNRPLKLKIR